MWNDWMSLASKAMILGVEAQYAMALRMARLATGGKSAEREAERMMADKLTAMTELSLVAALGAAAGRDIGQISQDLIRRTSRRVRKNTRRLSRSN
jgi:hypothetical protein